MVLKFGVPLALALCLTCQVHGQRMQFVFLETTTQATLTKEASAKPSETPLAITQPFALDAQPAYEGGQKALDEFMAYHLDYTDVARKYGVEGTMILRLTLSAQGKPVDVEVLRGLGYGMDQMVTQAIYQMPSWRPGKVAGRAVPTTYILPIRFRLTP